MIKQNKRNSLKMLLAAGGAVTAFLLLGFNLVSADPMVEAATVERIKPFGSVNVGVVPVAAAPAAADGKSIYSGTCSACHATGAAGSPKFGDKGAWKKRIAQGMDTLFKHAIGGFNAMPPKGGNAGLSDDAVKAAVKYMVKHSK